MHMLGGERERWLFNGGKALKYSIDVGSSVGALEDLKDAWTNTPPNWVGSDPCGSRWDGIQCNNNTRVTSITLESIGLTGQFTWDITPLSELQMLDLSYNKGLTGTLTPAIGNLTKLTSLILEGCNFYGPIPPTIGYLQQLTFLSLNSNGFSGKIPPSIGNLSNLFWLDLTNNSLSGNIPVSSGTTLGLDRLVNTQHFHFGNNQLSGPIPPSLFHSGMKLIHVLFDSNQLTGTIPSTLGLVQTLIVVRLDWNLLTGTVPSNFSSLVNLDWLYLSNNQLTGPVPNLSGLNSLSYMDLSNNAFDSSLFPSWLSNLQYLTTILMENTSLVGPVPPALFSLPELQRVSLSYNGFTGSLNVGSNYSNQLTIVDLQHNFLSYFSFTERADTNVTFILAGNPYCNGTEVTNTYCLSLNSSTSYSQPNNCPPRTCSPQQSYSPNCTCAYPYTGTLTFTAPPFSVLNSTIYTTIQNNLMSSFQSHQLPVDSVSLSYPTIDTYHNFVITLEVFPSGQNYFSYAGLLGIASLLSQVSSLLPSNYGFVYFSAGTYVYYAGGSSGTKPSNTGVIIGAAVGGSVLLLLALLLGFYALRQKRRAENTEVNNPFAAWDPNTTTGAAPLIQGAKYFSFDELKKYTNDFAEANSIGSGGYGKVYRGTLPDGQLVAIKRAKQASAQGGLEFKMEIELLSRVHHMNVVGLVGFCFDQSEQMLVYEYIANGTLNESLSGKTGIRLDWMRRLRIALGAARGLQYLHELANPPIIHRDIKSNNILLDERLNAKVADFGLSKPVGDTDKSHISTQVKGTMGYMDPEYYMTQQVTEKSDVYSFGVVLLELVTARQPIDKGKYIVREVREGMDRDQVLYGLDKILDPTILDPTPKGLENFVDLAMKCLEEEGARRPSMGAVVKEIENIMQIAGLKPNADSASSSATHEVDDTKGHIHPYTDDSLFVYSGAFPLSSN